MGVRQFHVGRGRLHGGAEKVHEHVLWNNSFVPRNWQTTFDNVEGACRGAAVGSWVVQHAIEAAVRFDLIVFKFVATQRHAQFTSHAVTVQIQRATGQLQRFVAELIAKVRREERFDALIDWWLVLAKNRVAFTKAIQHFARERRVGTFLVFFAGGHQAGKCQLEREIVLQTLSLFRSGRKHAVPAQSALKFCGFSQQCHEDLSGSNMNVVGKTKLRDRRALRLWIAEHPWVQSDRRLTTVSRKTLDPKTGLVERSLANTAQI